MIEGLAMRGLEVFAIIPVMVMVGMVWLGGVCPECATVVPEGE
jgi:hypothetical protein